jgi:hypothetical protein
MQTAQTTGTTFDIETAIKAAVEVHEAAQQAHVREQQQLETERRKSLVSEFRKRLIEYFTPAFAKATNVRFNYGEAGNLKPLDAYAALDYDGTWKVIEGYGTRNGVPNFRVVNPWGRVVDPRGPNLGTDINGEVLQETLLLAFADWRQDQANRQAEKRLLEAQEREQRRLRDERITAARADDAACLAEIAVARAEAEATLWRWPSAPADVGLTLYHWRWFTGHDSDGGAEYDAGWTDSDAADLFDYVTIQPTRYEQEKTRTLKLIPEVHLPTVERCVFAATAELPAELRETVTRRVLGMRKTWVDGAGEVLQHDEPADESDEYGRVERVSYVLNVGEQPLEWIRKLADMWDSPPF